MSQAFGELIGRDPNGVDYGLRETPSSLILRSPQSPSIPQYTSPRIPSTSNSLG